jgi:hypothetical protein
VSSASKRAPEQNLCPDWEWPLDKQSDCRKTKDTHVWRLMDVDHHHRRRLCNSCAVQGGSWRTRSWDWWAIYNNRASINSMQLITNFPI